MRFLLGISTLLAVISPALGWAVPEEGKQHAYARLSRPSQPDRRERSRTHARAAASPRPPRFRAVCLIRASAEPAPVRRLVASDKIEEGASAR